MKKAAVCLTTSLSLVSLTTAQAAPVAACITNEEMHGMVAYFMPAVLDEVSTNCTAHLPASSYLREGLPRLQDELGKGREAAWPMARAAFLKMAGNDDKLQMAKLSDRALRPLVDEILAEKMSIKTDTSTCGEVNDVAEALSTLSASQTVHLIATIFNVVARKDNKLHSCPRTPEQ